MVAAALCCFPQLHHRRCQLRCWGVRADRPVGVDVGRCCCCSAAVGGPGKGFKVPVFVLPSLAAALVAVKSSIFSSSVSCGLEP